uniref:Uncharacterized protein n=1 Tax=Oryza glumipatula TaxID=40148 RepID=A0A0D9ZKQ1_9ORYZ
MSSTPSILKKGWWVDHLAFASLDAQHVYRWTCRGIVRKLGGLWWASSTTVMKTMGLQPRTSREIPLCARGASTAVAASGFSGLRRRRRRWGRCASATEHPSPRMARFPSPEIASSGEVGSTTGFSPLAVHSGEEDSLPGLKKPRANLLLLETSLSLPASEWPGDTVSVAAA